MFVLEYIYATEIDSFTTDGKYGWRIKSRIKSDATAPWQICCFGCCDTIESAFKQAYENLQKQKEKIFLN